MTCQPVFGAMVHRDWLLRTPRLPARDHDGAWMVHVPEVGEGVRWGSTESRTDSTDACSNEEESSCFFDSVQ